MNVFEWWLCCDWRDVFDRWAVIGGCVRAMGCDWQMCASDGL